MGSIFELQTKLICLCCGIEVVSFVLHNNSNSCLESYPLELSELCCCDWGGCGGGYPGIAFPAPLPGVAGPEVGVLQPSLSSCCTDEQRLFGVVEGGGAIFTS